MATKSETAGAESAARQLAGKEMREAADLPEESRDGRHEDRREDRDEHCLRARQEGRQSRRRRLREGGGRHRGRRAAG